MWELSFASLKSLPLNEVKGQAFVNNKKDSEKIMVSDYFLLHSVDSYGSIYHYRIILDRERRDYSG